MVVSAKEQTKGRGQMGTKWESAIGKNLLFSLFISQDGLLIQNQFQLNQAISLGILYVLKRYLNDVKIKWPNDIMAGNKKIAGVLIENTFRNLHIKHSIVGIGLNVNQTEFSDELSQATSLKIVQNSDFDLDYLLLEIRDSIIKQILLLERETSEGIQANYLENMYLYQTSSTFFSKDIKMFKGMIDGVASDGRLLIKLPSKKIIAFGFKEIKFITQ